MLGMWDKIVEERIQESIRNGEFDNLPGQGKPINLDFWASRPEEIRAGYMLLHNQGVVPEEVYLLNEIGELRDRLANCLTQDVKIALNKQLKEVKLKYNLITELRKRKK
jgi:hypothetical protein